MARPASPWSNDKIFGHLIFQLGIDRTDPLADGRIIRKFASDFGQSENWVLEQLAARLNNLSDGLH
jgi:hypothetical protein